MQHKWIVLLTTLVLFSLLSVPAGTARAQDAPPVCPPYEDGLLKDKALVQTLPAECISSYKATAREAIRLAPPTPALETKATGGPDAFGYTFNDGVAYSWVSAGTNSGLSGDDQFTGPINIGFNFPFYGASQTQLYFNTNGLITFGAGTSEWGAYHIPNELNPNHFIAAFWDDLIVGSPYNSGAIYYARGGTAPNRYFVVEWRNVQNYEDYVTPFSFEAILYENGNILIQHQSLPDYYYSTVGIEDSSGYQGLQYQYGYSGLSAPKAIRFFYPAPAARILAYAVQPGGFVPFGGSRDFPIYVKNTGSLGPDTYDLTSFSSSWPFTYYAANGTTPLSDTDGDTNIDTGAIPVGGSATIIARFRMPVGAVVGASNPASVQITSSLNNMAYQYIDLSMSVPAPFANAFRNDSDGAMSFLTASVDGTRLTKATANSYFGYDVALSQLPNKNYVYAWERSSAGGRDIEYALLNRQGNLVVSPTKLTNNASATMYTSDGNVAVAVAPNGTVGVTWYRYLYNSSNGQYNYNILFATLSAAGARLTGPVSITNNAVWGSYNSLNVPRYYGPTIAATSDNRFVISWEDNRRVNTSTYIYNVWYAVRNTAGANVKVPTALTGNNISWGPVLNGLSGGKAIVTWITDTGGPYYAVLTSSGTIAKAATSLNAGSWYSFVDAVQLPNGKVAVAWANGWGVAYSLLNASYNIESGPWTASSPDSQYGMTMSVTTDASSRVIMSWIDGPNENKQLYALGDSNGTFLIQPMFYNLSRDGIGVNWRGQGTAPYQSSLVISGEAGTGSTTLSYTGGSTTSTNSGSYSFKVPLGWSGTVTPSKPGYIFSPAQRTYTNVVADQPGQGYLATQVYSISGNVGAAGVTLSYMDGTPKTVVSQPDGNYSLNVQANWAGTITPSHPCYTFNPTNRTYPLVNSNQTSQNYTPTLAPGSGCADLRISVGGIQRGRLGISSPGSTRLSFVGVNSGPVKIESTNGVPVMGAERLIYKVNGVNTSFAEMMGMPDSQLDTTYWLPWYNNVDLDTQLRFANVSGGSATVHVYVGGVEQGGGFTLNAGESTRQSFTGVNSGPVKIVSTAPIVVSERIIYKVNNVHTSFSEMMAQPNSQLDTTYWLPWYNNVDLDTQLRVANVTDQPATVTVTIGGVPQTPINLAAGESTRVSYSGVNNGPVKIVSTQNVVAAERIIYKVNGVNTSFTEMMAQPNSRLDTTYWLPWYNNVDLDTQLRFANVNDTPATVHVYIGGVEMGTGFTLAAGESTRQSFATLNNGPVQVVSNLPIVVSERIIYKVNNVNTSFSEMMGLPDNLLDTIYWLPWYNNVDLDTQLRFGVP